MGVVEVDCFHQHVVLLSSKLWNSHVFLGVKVRGVLSECYLNLASEPECIANHQEMKNTLGVHVMIRCVRTLCHDEITLGGGTPVVSVLCVVIFLIEWRSEKLSNSSRPYSSPMGHLSQSHSNFMKPCRSFSTPMGHIQTTCLLIFIYQKCFRCLLEWVSYPWIWYITDIHVALRTGRKLISIYHVEKFRIKASLKDAKKRHRKFKNREK